jgi:hypothetical protein
MTRVPTLGAIREQLGACVVEVVPIPWDCTDGFYGAYWRRPELYLRPEIRAGISIFRQLPSHVVEDAVHRLRADLESGAWDAALGSLRHVNVLDLGYRLLISDRRWCRDQPGT